MESDEGGEDPFLLEGERSGAAHSRPCYIQHEQDEGVRRHRDEASDGDPLSAGGGIRGVLADLRDPQVVVRLDQNVVDELRVPVR